MPDHSKMRLGKRPPRIDPRTLKFAAYLPAILPPPPPAVDWTKGFTAWGMLANDRLGDCTIAGVGHAVQLYCHNGWGDVLVTDQEVINYYSKWDGYDPADPSTDQGGVELDVLNKWRRDGFNGHRLLAYADIEKFDTAGRMSSLEHAKQAIAIFGCLYIGIALPITAQTQDVWDFVNPGSPESQPWSWGGHAVIVPKFETRPDGSTVFTCITWGQEKKMTENFWNAYVDEAHALLHRGWYPSGFSMDALLADLKAVAA